MDNYIQKKAHPSSRRPSTPATLIHKIKTTPLRTYRASLTPEHTLPDPSKFLSVPPLSQLDQRRLSKKPEKEEEETKNVLYTFYTKDEDLVATGRKVYGMKGPATGYKGHKDEVPLGRKLHRHYKWDSESGRVVRAAKNTSQLFKEFFGNPVGFSQTEVAFRWMLGVYREDTDRPAITRKVAAALPPPQAPGKHRKSHNVECGSFRERFGRKSWIIDPIHYREGRQSSQLYDKEDGKLRGSYDSPHRREEMKTRKKGRHDQEFLNEYEWSEIHPVVKTTSRFLIDRSPLSFAPKTLLPLPPLGAGREGEVSTVRKKSPPTQHNVIHIRLPNILL